MPFPEVPESLSGDDPHRDHIRILRTRLSTQAPLLDDLAAAAQDVEGGDRGSAGRIVGGLRGREGALDILIFGKLNRLPADGRSRLSHRSRDLRDKP